MVLKMGKKLVKSEKNIRDSMTLPSGNDVLGIARAHKECNVCISQEINAESGG